FLYSESLDSQKARNWSANLGGPAHGIAFLDSRVVAATLNGGITRIDANGKRTGFTQLPAPLTHIQLLRNALFAPGLDGRVYQVNAKTLELVKAWETNGYSESNRHFPTLLSTGDSLFAT